MRSNRVQRLVVPASMIGWLAILPAAAQSSGSYRLAEATINNGGNPRGAGIVASAHFHIRLDAIGDGVVGAGPASASFHADSGFVVRYPPPGEVTGVRWSSKTTLQWAPERSVGKYEVYRDLLASLPGSFGSCFADDSTAEAATDAASPVAGQGYFYLVTARNRLREEGTKGYRSNGAEEPNTSPCP